ncbi:YajQ family cyclic di-GMP-binding protein [bacterium]|nr:YajQ family cyclic di-GMP-binding protein [bacterium]
MAKDFSFDVVSEYDAAEMLNATDQAKRELATRYDFQGTGAKLEYDKDKAIISIEANSELKLETIVDVLESKFLKRNIDLRCLDKTAEITSGNMIYKKVLPLIKGLDQDKAKKITKLIRDEYPKVKSQIQGEAVRVSAGSKDDLQGVMQLLRGAELDFPVSFTNYR